MPGAEALGLAASLARHWSPWHLATNAVAITLLAVAIARRDGTVALGRVSMLAFALQVAVLAWRSGAIESRGSSGFAWALGAFILARHLGGLRAAILVALAWACMPEVSPVLPVGIAPDHALHAAGAIAGLLAAIQAPARASISSLLRLTNAAGSSSCPPSASRAWS